MFTQFGTKISHKSSILEKSELAISEIEKIVDGRIAYNKELETFVREASVSEIQAYFQSVQKTDPTVFAGFDSAKNVAFKMMAIQGIQEDIAFYEKIQKIISERARNQAMIDELHYEFSKEYKFYQFYKTNQFLKEQETNKYLESTFLEEMINKLEPLISEVESEFMSIHKFIFKIVNSKRQSSVAFSFSNEAHVFQKYSRLNDKVGEYLGSYAKKCEDANINDYDKWELSILFSSLTRMVPLKITGMQETYTQNSGNVWHIYRDDYEEYCNALKLAQEVETHPLFSAVATEQPEKSKNARKKARKKANKQKKLENAKKEDNEGEVVDEGEQQTSVSGQPLVESKDENEPVDVFALRLKEWKVKVAQRKAEKQRAIDEKNRVECLRFEEQKKREEYLVANKQEFEYKNACELLSSLNAKNLELIEEMFQKPTPHCKIRYQQIESLFGTEQGKLPGAITSVGGGSHRKICIQDRIGFFDYYETGVAANMTNDSATSEFESKTKNVEVVGGMFEAHKANAQGGSKLPAIAIKMICSTLERVGITAVNIGRYQDSKKTALTAA